MPRANVIVNDSKEVTVLKRRTATDQSRATCQMTRLARRRRFVQEK